VAKTIRCVCGSVVRGETDDELPRSRSGPTACRTFESAAVSARPLSCEGEGQTASLSSRRSTGRDRFRTR
jgi:hypothetical protein